MSAEYLIRLREAHRAIGDLLRGVDWAAFDRCECGHLRVEHHVSQPPDGHQPCSHHQCGCEDYDDLHTQEQNPLRKAA